MNVPTKAQTPRGPSLLPAVACHLLDRLELEHHSAHACSSCPAQDPELHWLLAESTHQPRVFSSTADQATLVLVLNINQAGGQPGMVPEQ